MARHSGQACRWPLAASGVRSAFPAAREHSHVRTVGQHAPHSGRVEQGCQGQRLEREGQGPGGGVKPAVAAATAGRLTAWRLQGSPDTRRRPARPAGFPSQPGSRHSHAAVLA